MIVPDFVLSSAKFSSAWSRRLSQKFNLVKPPTSLLARPAAAFQDGQRTRSGDRQRRGGGGILRREDCWQADHQVWQGRVLLEVEGLHLLRISTVRISLKSLNGSWKTRREAAARRPRSSSRAPRTSRPTPRPRRSLKRSERRMRTNRRDSNATSSLRGSSGRPTLPGSWCSSSSGRGPTRLTWSPPEMPTSSAPRRLSSFTRNG